MAVIASTPAPWVSEVGGFQLVLALVRLAQTSVRLMERGQWFREGERRQIMLEMEAGNRALKKAMKVRSEVDKMTDEQVLAALKADGDLLPS